MTVCPTCEALARTVMLDQTYHDLHREWVGLTIEEKHQLNDILNLQGRFNVIDAIEAKLRKKNT